MSKIKDLPTFKRPREKLEFLGAHALYNHELLAILLRTGYKGKSVIEIAKRILSRYSLKQLAQLSFQDLSKIKGVGKSRASIIISAFSLASRADPNQNDIRINSPEDAVKVLSFIKDKKREYLVAIYLDAENKLIAHEIISIGSLDTSIAHPREVFYYAVKHKAVSIIIAHNHPSGNLTPSTHDIKVTKTISQAGQILNIELIDHLIITKNNYTSLKKFT